MPRRSRTSGVLFLDLDQGLGEASRIIDECLALRVERGERIESGARHPQRVEGVEDDDVAHEAPVHGRRRAQLTLHVDDDHRTVAQAEEVRDQHPRAFACARSAEQYDVALAAERQVAADLAVAPIPAKIDRAEIDRARRLGGQLRMKALIPKHCQTSDCRS